MREPIRYADDDAVDYDYLARLGRRVSAIRALTGLTPEQVERLADLECGTMDGIESGTVDVGPYALLDVAEAMGVSFDFLLDTGYMDPFELYSRRVKPARA